MVDKFIGSNPFIPKDVSVKPGSSSTGKLSAAGQNDFKAELNDVFAKHTGNLVGTSVGDLGPIYTAKPENLQTLLNMKGSIV